MTNKGENKSPKETGHCAQYWGGVCRRHLWWPSLGEIKSIQLHFGSLNSKSNENSNYISLPFLFLFLRGNWKFSGHCRQPCRMDDVSMTLNTQFSIWYEFVRLSVCLSVNVCVPKANIYSKPNRSWRSLSVGRYLRILARTTCPVESNRIPCQWWTMTRFHGK